MEWFQKDTEKAHKSPRAGGKQLPTGFDPPTVPPSERSLLTSTILVPDRPTQGGRLFTANVQLFVGKSTKPVKAELGKTSKSVTLTPSSKLDANTTYRAVVSTGVKDLGDNALDQDQNPNNGNQPKQWTFHNGPKK